MSEVAPSVMLMLHRGQLLQGHQIDRNVAILVNTAEDAWGELLAGRECNLRLAGDNLENVRAMYAGWVMEAQR